MKENEKTIYIANAWSNLITKTACHQFERQGWKIDGNWLNKKEISSLYKVILASPAYFDGAITVYPKDFSYSRIFAHLLYPDELVGWDFKNNIYQLNKQNSFVPLLEGSPILSHSKYTLDLVVSTYGEFLNKRRDVTYLPIEFNHIQKIKRGESVKKKTGIKVLWNHMWRSDKGFKEALGIIDKLSKNYTNVEFWIGREESWGSNPDVNSVRNETREMIQKLRKKDNVFFQPNFLSAKVIDYWRFLGQFDIGFSVSHQEGFGLSMLEQSAAGIACVMPPKEAYPEIHLAGLLTKNITEGIAQLIENPQKRREISQNGQENASKFKAEDWAKRILNKII